ncbi:MAG: hypothetical protein ACYSUK_00205 [Planctomycetota bacterium]|jgi:hypothetical protein
MTNEIPYRRTNENLNPPDELPWAEPTNPHLERIAQLQADNERLQAELDLANSTEREEIRCLKENNQRLRAINTATENHRQVLIEIKDELLAILEESDESS